MFEVPRVAEVDPVRAFDPGFARGGRPDMDAFGEALAEATRERPPEPTRARRQDDERRAPGARSGERRDPPRSDTSRSDAADRDEGTRDSSLRADERASGEDVREPSAGITDDKAANDTDTAAEPDRDASATPDLAIAASQARTPLAPAILALAEASPGGTPTAMAASGIAPPAAAAMESGDATPAPTPTPIAAGVGASVAKPGKAPAEKPGAKPTVAATEGTLAVATGETIAADRKAAKAELEHTLASAGMAGPTVEKPEPKAAKPAEPPSATPPGFHAASSEAPRTSRVIQNSGAKPIEPLQSTGASPYPVDAGRLDPTRPQPLQVANTAQAPREAIPIERVAIEVAAAARDGARQFEIRLDPADLGRIDVSLEVAKDGTITAKLVVEKSETLDQLRRDAGSLEKAFSEMGLKTDGGGMSFELARQNRDDARDQGSERARATEDEDTETLIARQEARVVYRGFAGPRGVDVRI